MGGVADVEAARALWRDAGAPVHRRCLAARALGLLGKHGQDWRAEDVKQDWSALDRARQRGTRDAQKHRLWEIRDQRRQESLNKQQQLGAESIGDVIRSLRDRTAQKETRMIAAFVLGGLKASSSVDALVDVLAEGEEPLSNACAHVLIEIGSRRGSRRLMRIVRGKYSLAARQEALYVLRDLGETRTQSLFIHLCRALDTEDEFIRDMATEGLGHTVRRLRTQRALAERLFDPSVSVRCAALCACSMYGRPLTLPEFLLDALKAKLTDPDRLNEREAIAEQAAELLSSR